MEVIQARMERLEASSERLESRFDVLHASLRDLTDIVIAGFDRFENRFERIDARLGAIDARFAEMDHRLNGRIDDLREEMHQGFTGVDARLRRLERPSPKRRR